MQHTCYGAHNRPFVRPIVLANKEQYLLDIAYLERIMFDDQTTYSYNTFLHEIVQLMINAIHLFVSGYYDNAYYSIRQALELSVLIYYFSLLSDQEKQQKHEAWISGKNFPTLATMLNNLKHKNIKKHMDFLEKLSPFFEELYTYLNRINKVIHKQGWYNLYVVQNKSGIIKRVPNNEMVINFLNYLEKGINSKQGFAIDDLYDYENVVVKRVSKKLWRQNFDGANYFKYYDSKDEDPFILAKKKSKKQILKDIFLKKYRLIIVFLFGRFGLKK